MWRPAPRRRGLAARAARTASAAAPAPARASRSRRIRSGQPLRVLQIAAQPRLQGRHALLADQEPQLQRAEAAAERDAPVAVVLHAAVGGRLQVARVGGHHAHEVLGVAHEVDRAVERRAEPLVRVEHERVGALDALPHPAALGQDHGRAGHRGIDVQPRRRARRATSAIASTGSSAVRGRGAGGRHDRARAQAARPVVARSARSSASARIA